MNKHRNSKVFYGQEAVVDKTNRAPVSALWDQGYVRNRIPMNKNRTWPKHRQ